MEVAEIHVLYESQDVMKTFHAVVAVATVILSLGGCTTASDAGVTPDRTTVGHEDEAQFDGVVTGFLAPEGNYGTGCDELLCVRVDDATVNLSLIGTFGPSCYGGAIDDDAAAIMAKEGVLPVGTNVRVVRTGPADNYEGFIQIISDDVDERGAAGSVNELLVSTGYWVPEAYSGQFNTTQVGAALDSEFRLLENAHLTVVEEQYAPFIAEAANVARAVGAGGQAICVAQLAQKAADDAASAALLAKSQRDASSWYAEWLLTHPGGLVGCRDGDGDGRCHEH